MDSATVTKFGRDLSLEPEHITEAISMAALLKGCEVREGDIERWRLLWRFLGGRPRNRQLVNDWRNYSGNLEQVLRRLKAIRLSLEPGEVHGVSRPCQRDVKQPTFLSIATFVAGARFPREDVL